MVGEYIKIVKAPSSEVLKPAQWSQYEEFARHVSRTKKKQLLSKRSWFRGRIALKPLGPDTSNFARSFFYNIRKFFLNILIWFSQKLTSIQRSLSRF